MAQDGGRGPNKEAGTIGEKDGAELCGHTYHATTVTGERALLFDVEATKAMLFAQEITTKDKETKRIGAIGSVLLVVFWLFQ